MSATRNSMAQILKVTLLLCLICAIIVSFAAIGLRPLQKENMVLERNANMLAAAGLLDMSSGDAKSMIPELMQRVTTRLIELKTGEFSDEFAAETYNQRAASKDLSLSAELPSYEDIASIKRLERLGQVFFVMQNDEVDSVILPIRGYALWSTLYGFIALENDGNTIRGLGFYEHSETPGLGGEIDNPKWKALWKNKQLLSEDGKLSIAVVKNLNMSDPYIVNKVDSISGASLTSRGVHNLVRFWLGDNGYGPFLDRLRNNEVQI